MTAAVLAVLLQVIPLLPPPGPPVDVVPDRRWCMMAQVTGYVREPGAFTYDGTPITTSEAIAAASWNIPIDSYVEVDGIGVYRVADRGLLGWSGWIDIAVWSLSEAYALTSRRQVCVLSTD